MAVRHGEFLYSGFFWGKEKNDDRYSYYESGYR